MPNNEPVIMKALCPELQEIMWNFAKHLKECPSCYQVLHDHGVAILMPHILQTEKMLAGIDYLSNLLSLIKKDPANGDQPKN